MHTLTVSALPSALGGHLLRGLRRHAWFYGAILLFTAAGQILSSLYGLEDYFQVALYLENLPVVLFAFFSAFVIGHAVFVMAVKRPDRLVAHLVRDYRERFLLPERLTNGLLLILVLPIFFSVFTSFKVMIPKIHPFSWDETFALWDQTLHGGVAPWELLQPLLGFPAATVAINFAYHLWLFVLYGLLFWQGFSLANPRLRMQYLLATVLTWSLLGSLLATLLSSAGPCYYHFVSDGPNPFAPLMAYLHETAETHYVPALHVQELLWNDHQGGGIDQARGVSAMPSMHVSSAFLFALLGWRVHRWLGWVLTGFFVLILVGSVHLGWHYAIDGYLAIPLTWLIWRLAGWLVDLDPLFKRPAASATPD